MYENKRLNYMYGTTHTGVGVMYKDNNILRYSHRKKK